MKKISCIIVEDEPASQEILARYIKDFPQLELLSICSNAVEANDFLHGQEVDLLFLDINMPRLSGLDFYKSLSNPPHVIFTTAYPEYAVHGFEVNAVDYLVKPFPFERFVKATNRYMDTFRQAAEPVAGYILLHADKKMHKVNHDDIFTIEAMGDYAKVNTTSKPIIVHQTLQKLQEQLPANSFFRIHKSYIISLQRLEYIEGNMAIVNRERVPIGQTYRTEFLDFFNKRRPT
jgi:DNA-binding LytR/AlgR family response regulator